MTTPAAPQERATLSRELGEFLIELSIALHKHAMYPEGHPSLAPAAAAVGRRAGDLLRDRATLSLGVAHHQLVIEGVATDPKHPVLSELAGRLHRHHLGAITFTRGITSEEIRAGLRILAEEADRAAEPLGLRPRDALPTWEHLRLHPLTYERLELLEEGGEDVPPETRGARARSAQLWVGLARAALAGQLSDDQMPDTKPAVVAQAIDAHPRGEAYDQVIVGYLLQIAEELQGAGGREGADLRRRTSRLIGELKPETLRRLVEMGGDNAQRRKFVLDATHGMAVDAVLELLRAAADTSRQTISHSLIRMLSKLAVHAEQGTAQARPLADAALREQVERLLAGWELDDPNPGAYGAALQQMAKSAPVFAAPVEPAYASEDDRMVQMSVEVDTLGPLVWKAVDRLADGPDLARLLDLLDGAPAGRAVVASIRDRVMTPASLTAALGVAPVSFPLVDRLS
ncbi:MAG TPA: hypothetical protein VNG95_01820, partial [Gemmatimonadales bacterium]|nr:hypothetical protein [Gemmatimonadales bacterium]